ncbi:MAG: hypothetical protein LC723_06365 [Actinobacteria bacterium]|nr:hypothetical protein [Actinomycetota bacterium]
MPTYNLNEFGSDTFDANGTAVVTLSPTSLEYWDITSMGVQTTDPTTETVIPEARVTLDGVYKQGSYSGNFDASDTPFHIEKGQQFTCTWTGGTAGRTATFSVNGTRSTYS